MASQKTVRKIMFGRYMQELREQVEPKLSREAVADHVTVSRPTVARMETGDSIPGNRYLVVAYLGVYNATDEQRLRAMKLWENAKQPSKAVANAADLPKAYLALRMMESDAAGILAYNPFTLHGMVQTAATAAAIAKSAWRFSQKHGKDWDSEAAAVRQASERRERQQLIEGDNPLAATFLISEAALLVQVGGVETWRAQLERIAYLASLDHVTIRIVPFGTGAVGNMSGPFTILQFDDDQLKHMVYCESATGGELVENTDDVTAFVGTFADTEAVALPAEATAGWIAAALEQEER